MSADLLRLTANLARMAFSSNSSRKAIAAAFKVCGHRLETRWPFLSKAAGKDLNLSFDDLLAFQWARAGEFSALVVGAYDGVANDPASEFIRVRGARAVFVEPQPAPFERLRGSMADYPRVQLVNAAIDQTSSSREFFTVPSGIAGLPSWTEQLGSFDRAHLLKHEDRAPGLAQHIVTLTVPTLSFADVLDRFAFTALDLLQIDAEGMDAQLLAWFPFERLKPALLYYETVHMTSADHAAVTNRLTKMGYRVFTSESPTDDMAVLF